MAVTGKTNGVILCTSQGDAITGELIPDSIAFKEATSKGSVCKVATGSYTASEVVFRSKADASYMIDIKYFDRMFTGLKVISLGSGIVEITLK